MHGFDSRKWFTSNFSDGISFPFMDSDFLAATPSPALPATPFLGCHNCCSCEYMLAGWLIRLVARLLCVVTSLTGHPIHGMHDSESSTATPSPALPATPLPGCQSCRTCACTDGIMGWMVGCCVFLTSLMAFPFMDADISTTTPSPALPTPPLLTCHS